MKRAKAKLSQKYQWTMLDIIQTKTNGDKIKKKCHSLLNNYVSDEPLIEV